MDPERQPLLSVNTDVRYRRFRPLTYEEVQLSREDVHWNRSRCLLVLLFWAVIAMCLSLIACILVTTPSCKTDDVTTSVPSVPPVHMTLAPLILRGRALSDGYESYSI